MKYLSDYTKDAQTIMFNELGVFFAFSKEQFKEAVRKLEDQKILEKGDRITTFGAGTYCPSKNAEEFMSRLDKITSEGMQLDMKENGINKIVLRELDNYECYFTGDIENAWPALEKYGVSKDKVWKKFQNQNYNIEI